ncbi:unnamed protein product [marine sediment metagenome]|uniref:Uncharacterized protein n=1 Tax=marine sediment metagenome TaxID=412755 RepID=X1GGH9_9ZZZZ
MKSKENIIAKEIYRHGFNRSVDFTRFLVITIMFFGMIRLLYNDCLISFIACCVICFVLAYDHVQYSKKVKVRFKEDFGEVIKR